MTWNYVAGFFDGEGSINHNGRGFRVTISQSQLKVLEEIRDFTGVGSVIAVRKRKAHWKDAWVYYIARQSDVAFFLNKVRKFVIVKSAKLEEVLPRVRFIADNAKFKMGFKKVLISEAQRLRRKGLTYRAIGEILHKDFGYIRRIIS